MKVFLSLMLLSFIPWLQAAQVLAPDLLSKAKKCQDDEVPYRVRVNKRLDLNCYKVVELPDLEGKDLCFTGKFFSLKKSDSEEPVCFDQWKSSTDEEITTITRAATVYISLTKARNFYLNHSIYTSKVANEKYPITVRIDQKASFDQSSETAPFNLTVEAKNNALTIGPSDFQSEITVNDKVIKPWNKEIWFNQAIPAKVQSTLETAGNIMRQRKVKNIIMYPFYVSKTYDLIEESAQALQNDYYANVLYNPEIHLYTLAIAQAVVELIPEIMRLTAKFFYDRHHSSPNS